MNKIYTRETIIEGLHRFTQENGHEPSAIEIDGCSYLPTSRQIQRLYGGLQRLRTEAGMTNINHNTGAQRSMKAAQAQNRANDYESEILTAMIKKHHDPVNFMTDVIREYAYQQYIAEGNWYKNIYCDVAIVYREKQHVVMFDLFYPKDMHSLVGCANVKLRKLKNAPVSLIPPYTHEVILVSVNPDISQDEIDTREVSKKGIKLLSFDQFRAKYL